MNPEEKALLQKVAAQVEENNLILRKIQRSQRFATITKIVYWGLIIVLSVGAYVLIQPYIDMLNGLGGKVTGSIDQLGQMSELLKDL